MSVIYTYVYILYLHMQASPALCKLSIGSLQDSTSTGHGSVHHGHSAAHAHAASYGTSLTMHPTKDEDVWSSNSLYTFESADTLTVRNIDKQPQQVLELLNHLSKDSNHLFDYNVMSKYPNGVSLQGTLKLKNLQSGDVYTYHDVLIRAFVFTHEGDEHTVFQVATHFQPVIGGASENGDIINLKWSDTQTEDVVTAAHVMSKHTEV